MGMRRHQSTPALGGVDPGRASPQKGKSTEATPLILIILSRPERSELLELVSLRAAGSSLSERVNT